MNTLTTRKIVLGMLMTLVLAFSVQGIADAYEVTYGAGSKLQYQWKTADADTYNSLPAPFEFIVSGSTLSEIAIEFAAGRIDKITGTLDDDTINQDLTSPVALASDDVRNGSRVKIYFSVTNGDGVYTVTATPRVQRATPVTFYAYAVETDATASNFTITKLTGTTSTPGTIPTLQGIGRDRDIAVTLSDTANTALVDFKVIEGNGRLYLKNPTAFDPTTNTGFNEYQNLTTLATHTVSGIATVGIKLGSNTTKVRARVRYTYRDTAPVYSEPEADHVITFIYGRPFLSISYNGDLEGATGGQLPQPVVVEVRDASNRTVSGQAVKITTGNGMLKAMTGTTVFATNGTTLVGDAGPDNIPDSFTTRVVEATDALIGESMFVETNRNGKAEVYLQLSSDSTDTETTVMASISNGVNTPQLTARIVNSEPTGFEISSGDGQTADNRGNVEDLVVYVTDPDGYAFSEAYVEFSTGTGTLSDGVYGIDETGTVLPDGADDTKTRIVKTGADGKASVDYNVKIQSQVFATLYPNAKGDGNDDDTVTTGLQDTINSRNELGSAGERLVFGINGAPGSGNTGGTTQPPPGTGTGIGSSVSPTSLSGAPGSTYTLTVNAGAANTDIAIGNVAFSVAGGSASPNSINTGTGTSVQSTITLPSTVGTYSLSVRIGTVVQTVSITVTAAADSTTTTTGTLSLSVPRSGTAGDVLDVRVTATMADGAAGAGVDVTLTASGGVGTLSSRTIRTDSAGIGIVRLTLGAAGSSGFVTASATDYRSQQLRVTVAGNPADSLSRTSGNNQSGEPESELDDPFVVTALDEDNNPVSGVTVTFRVTSGGGSLSTTSIQTNARGQASTVLTLGDDPGTNSVRATVSGVPSVTFSATATGEPTALVIASGNNQRGTLNEELDDPLVVQALDDDENGVGDVRVVFRLTSGQGTISESRTGRALSVRTNARGFAQIDFTPTGAGTIRITASSSGLDPVSFTVTTGPPPASIAKVSGDNQAGTPGSALSNALVVEVQDAQGNAVQGVAVTFAVTAGGGSLSATTATTNASGRAQTSLTLGSERAVNSVSASVTGLDAVTFNTSIDAVIHVAAANRPVMYWIDGGVLYRLAGERATKIADSANDVAIGGGKIYWTAQTGERAGEINSANLNGTNVQTVKETPYNVPLSLAVDSANEKLYWIDSRDRIRNVNLDGTGGQTVLQNLPDPMHIAVSGGNAYWSEGAGRIRRVNLTGQKITREIATGLGAIGGLSVSGNKVYWSEDAGDGTGGIYRANLNGTNVQTVKETPYNVPLSLAVDSANGKLYWTDSKGKVRSSSLSGGKVRLVAEGLISPSKLVIGGANVASDPARDAQPDTTAKSKYDVNGDGTVDNADAALVAGASGTSTAAYDVNDDGTVNFLDLLLVFDNRDNAAAAPTVARTRLTAVQVDRIREQIDLLLATNDRSPVALYTLQYLQSLIAVARPEKTQLLANYPNPFNPETWMPYELATDTNVKLTIYNAQGVVVRTLSLGHQSAGYYTGRDRAAYWDGRNAFGELVASGLYFYQLETDTTSSMRKMVILK